MGQFILKNIEMTLDERSIGKAIQEVNRFKEKLQPAMQCLITWLAEKGVEVAKAELIFMPGPPYMSGDLQNSILYRKIGDYAEITAGEGLITEYGSYAMFVEYGTGFIGANHPHPEADKAGYKYDVHKHGMRGWWYPAPWGTIEAEGGTKLAWTQGMASRPFMYNTLRDLEEEAEASGGRIIAEYIRGERA